MSELEFKTTYKDTSQASIEDSRESLTVEMKELKSNQFKIEKVVNEMQSKLEALPAGINEEEKRISDTENKTLENKETEKKRDKQLLDHKGRI